MYTWSKYLLSSTYVHIQIYFDRSIIMIIEPHYTDNS